jgi:peptidoglycan/xylan/chitin deacetylase (PgdA/CDA1 family)
VPGPALITNSEEARPFHPCQPAQMGDVSARAVGMAQRVPGPWRHREPVVLMYHGFSRGVRQDDPDDMFVTSADFEAQLDHLLAHGWQALDLDGFLAARSSRDRSKSFLVTIDDGLDSVAELAAPALRSRAIPAVVFVPAGLVGRTAEWLAHPPHEPIMDRWQLLDLTRDGLVEVGAHGFEHVDMRGLDPKELVRQTSHACEVLAGITGATVRAFAYPYGLHDRRARDAVARAGCRVGFSLFEDETRFAVSRVNVNATDTMASFRLKLVPGYRAWWRRAGRAAVVRRAVRRSLSRRPRAVEGAPR